MSVLVSHTFESINPGPRLLITGAVHGNEVCGPIAISRWLDRFREGKAKLAQGRLTFIPICNPFAYAADQRYINWNLNRDLRIKDNPANDEERIGNLLCKHLQNCDALLDIHSYSAGGPPFLFSEGASEKQRAFATSLGVETVLFGWQQAYAALPDGMERLKYAVGTTEYCRQQGGIAVTLECGQHRDPEAPEVADAAIGRALAHFDLLQDGVPLAPIKVTEIRMERVYLKPHSETAFTADWKHLQPVKAGTVLYFHEGQPVSIDRDGFLIMPRAASPVHEEWLYWGVAA